MAKTSLRKHLEELSKPQSKDFDIEDTETGVFDDEVTGSGSDGSDSDSESKRKDIHSSEHYVSVGRSKLRNGVDKLQLGGKYEGQKSSRDSIYARDAASDGVSDDESEDDISADEGSGEELQQEEQSEENDSGEVSFDDSEDGDSGSEPESGAESDITADNIEEDAEDGDESYKRTKLKALMENERKHIVGRLSSASKMDSLKGYAILQQHKTFDAIIDARIKLQKAVTASNQLPITRTNYKETGHKDKKERKETVSKLYSLLGQIYEMRELLLQKDKIVKPDFESKLGKKRSFEEALEATDEYDSILNQYRDSVLTKWSARISSASGASALNSSKFKAINQDSLKQVQNNLTDIDKLIRRTQLNRKSLKPIGGLDLDVEQGDRSLQYSSYIFDDEDFYRVLLNDLIDKKLSSNEKISSNLTISKAPTKLHKNYERKASKGRKLNYQIQESISNFEAPKPLAKKWADDQIDEFFASLLGQKVNMAESDLEDGQDDEDEPIADTGLKIFG